MALYEFEYLVVYMDPGKFDNKLRWRKRRNMNWLSWNIMCSSTCGRTYLRITFFPSSFAKCEHMLTLNRVSLLYTTLVRLTYFTCGHGLFCNFDISEINCWSIIHVDCLLNIQLATDWWCGACPWREDYAKWIQNSWTGNLGMLDDNPFSSTFHIWKSFRMKFI